jgi:hypothetical protein
VALALAPCPLCSHSFVSGGSTLTLQCCRNGSSWVSLLLFRGFRSRKQNGNGSLVTLCLILIMFLTTCPFSYNSFVISLVEIRICKPHITTL